MITTGLSSTIQVPD